MWVRRRYRDTHWLSIICTIWTQWWEESSYTSAPPRFCWWHSQPAEVTHLCLLQAGLTMASSTETLVASAVDDETALPTMETSVPPSSNVSTFASSTSGPLVTHPVMGEKERILVGNRKHKHLLEIYVIKLLKARRKQRNTEKKLRNTDWSKKKTGSWWKRKRSSVLGSAVSILSSCPYGISTRVTTVPPYPPRCLPMPYGPAVNTTPAVTTTLPVMTSTQDSTSEVDNCSCTLGCYLITACSIITTIVNLLTGNIPIINQVYNFNCTEY